MRNVLFVVVITICILNSLIAQNSNLQTTMRLQQFNIAQSKLALQGYDVVSYFTVSKPQKGNATYSYMYNGITYQFVSTKNLTAFKTNPAKYEPAYGGWCAYAMGEKGEKVEIDPETYKIKEGKLYLFYNAFFNNTLPKWNSDESTLNKKADLNWTKFYK